MKLRFSPLAVALLLFAEMAQAQSVSLRQSSIFEGDVAELTITHEAGIASLYALDTDPLLTDFEVLDTRSRISRIVRESGSAHRMEWRVHLVPRRSGRLRIPALGFGGYQSEESWIDVLTPDPETTAREQIFVEIEAIPDNPYPGQQVRIVMRLLHNLPRLGGNMIEPKLPTSDVFRGSLDLNYEAVRDDRRFSVLERSILVTAPFEQSLTIPPVSFRGSFFGTSSSQSANPSARETRYVFRRSNGLKLAVRERPPGMAESPWLPASELRMEMQWEQGVEAPRVGDSLGLSLLLATEGLPATALPEDFLLQAFGQLRVFADKAERNTRVEHAATDLQLNSSLRQRFVIILDRAGEVTLPKLELDWWDVEADRLRTVSLPATTLTVAPSAASARQPERPSSHTRAVGESARGLLPLPVLGLLPWIGALLAGLIFVLMARALVRRLEPRWQAFKSLRQARRRLLQACLANDCKASYSALIDWARLHWRSIRINSLRDISDRVASTQWSEQLHRLDKARYSQSDITWSGSELARLVTDFGRRQGLERSRSRHELPGLYPTGRAG